MRMLFSGVGGRQSSRAARSRSSDYARPCLGTHHVLEVIANLHHIAPRRGCRHDDDPRPVLAWSGDVCSNKLQQTRHAPSLIRGAMSGKRKASALDAALAKFQKVQASAAQIQIDVAKTRDKPSTAAKADRLKAMAEAEAAERRVRLPFFVSAESSHRK